MPNHVTTVCTITGPEDDVTRFEENHGAKFDFDTIIPRPESIKATESGSEASLGVFALTGHFDKQFVFQPQTEAEYLRAYCYRFGVSTREDLRNYLAEHNPRALALGRAAVAAFEETGFYDWYEWCCARWGTKWGAYSVEPRERAIGKLVFKFETAWSFPTPIFERLAKLYPSLTFSVLSFDEGWGFACTGEFNGACDFATVKATEALYVLVYGHASETGDEDDEDAGGAIGGAS